MIPFKKLLNELNVSYKALIIGVIGGYIGTLIGLPLPWLLGALGLNLCIAFTNFKIEFSAILILSATTTSSIAIDKLHFVIGGGAGGGWDGTARGTGEALTKAGFLKSASFENMSGGGGGKALAYMINTKPENTVLVQSTPLVLRSITRHKGYVSGSGVLSYKDVVPIAGVIGDYGAIAVAKNSPYKNFKLSLIHI